MVLSQSHLNHPHHHLHHHDHFDSNDRSFLSILTDPIVSLFRSIPIEILDKNEELSPSQKDFLADFVEIRIECKEDDPTELLQFDGQLISTVVVDVLSDVLDKVEEMEQDESFKNVEIPQIIVEETTSFPCIDIVVQSFDKLQDIPVELTDSGLFSDIDEDDSSDFGIDEAIPLEIFEPIEEVSATTSCSFIRSQSSARCKIILPDNSFVCTLPPISATFSAPVITPKKVIKRKKSVSTTTKMAAEVLQNEPHCFIASSSSIDRPFKLLVQKETFLIDAESMSRISPIFNVMCFGKDFEKMDLSREIVDEKSNDIDCFLRAVHDTSMINSSNFALVLRLSNKYQVDPVIEACQNFIIRQHLDVLRADEILTMLIAAFEHHCRKEVVQKLIKRLASEGNSVFTKLKISRYLPAQVYGSVISTSMNLNQIKEHEQMNGHCLKQERSKIRWRQSVCDECKSVAECANCDECKKTMCRNHVSNLKCSSDYGTKMAADLKKKIVDFEWQD